MTQKKEGVAYQFPSNNPFVYDLAFSNYGEVLFFPDDKTIKAYIFDDQRFMGDYSGGHTEAITALAVSSDSLFMASGDKSSRIVLWNLIDREIIEILDFHSDAVLSLAISSCNNFLASGSADNTVSLFDINQRKVVETYRVFRDNVTSVKFSHNGYWLGAVSGDGQIILVDMETKAISDKKQANTYLRDLDFHQTNNELVTAGNNGRVGFWSISENGILSNRSNSRGGFNWITSIQLTPDGKSYMIADHRGRVRIQTQFGRIDKNLRTPIFRAILRPNMGSRIVVVTATRGKGVEVFTGFEMNHRL